MELERKHLRSGVNDLLSVSREFVERVSLYQWQESEAVEVERQLLFRSILRKQFESLEAIAKLSSQKQGHISVSLLRPMCEELIWVEYLLSISPQDGELLLLSMARIGVHETFCAQKNGNNILDTHEQMA